MFRLIVSVPVSMLLALVMFYLLALTTSMGNGRIMDEQMQPSLDFLMVRQESALELRKRQLPPEPEEVVQQQPEMPRLQLQAAPAVSAAQLDISVPDISMQMDMTLAPSLQGLVAPAPVMALDHNPSVLSQVPPRYPQRALRRKQEGRVLVEFIVTESGTVKPGSVVVLESTPEGVFDKAVLRSIQRWRFKPRVTDGQAHPYKARQELEFRLEK
ncbi:MAG: TonB family protein [Amphritea sp.]|nr:TonB family protein [Amphritea sp.]